jgi:hypothetical protein
MPCPGEVCLGLVDHHPGHVKAEQECLMRDVLRVSCNNCGRPKADSDHMET